MLLLKKQFFGHNPLYDDKHFLHWMWKRSIIILCCILESHGTNCLLPKWPRYGFLAFIVSLNILAYADTNCILISLKHKFHIIYIISRHSTGCLLVCIIILSPNLLKAKFEGNIWLGPWESFHSLFLSPCRIFKSLIID